MIIEVNPYVRAISSPSPRSHRRSMVGALSQLPRWLPARSCTGNDAARPGKMRLLSCLRASDMGNRFHFLRFRDRSNPAIAHVIDAQSDLSNPTVGSAWAHPLSNGSPADHLARYGFTDGVQYYRNLAGPGAATPADRRWALICAARCSVASRRWSKLSKQYTWCTILTWVLIPFCA